MPPRTVKKATGLGGPKKTPARASKSTPKKKAPPQVPDEPAEVEEVSVSIGEIREEKVEEAKLEQIVEEEPSKERLSLTEPEVKPEANGLVYSLQVSAKDGGLKGAIDEDDDEGERLDLEDNELEYEPEEDPGVEYEEVEDEDEDEDGQDEGDDAEVEDQEGDVGEEEEGDMVDEEIEDGVEGEEDGVNEEHEDIVEEEEHHEVANERRKRKEYEVFVGGLDKDASEEDLKKVFSVVGEIAEVRLMMNPQTKKNKGFAFLRFATVEQAKRAVSELKNPVVRGKQCGVNPRQDDDTLFLGNICKTWTKEALKEKLKHYGIENVEDLNLVEDTINGGMNRGFAFLEFASRSHAMDAYKRLQKRDVMFGVNRTAKVAFADSFIEPDDEIMKQVKTVFVDGLPPSWDEDRVKEHLKKFGAIEKIELARNRPSAKRKDFGFVTFETHDMAEACAEGINNSELGEGDSKVKVRARLSRPYQVGRLKRGVRGAIEAGRGSWGHPTSHRISGRGSREIESHVERMAGRGFRRPIGLRDGRRVVVAPERVRHLPPPTRSYDRRPPIPRYPKSSKRDYGRHVELPPRSRVLVDYDPRVAAERRSSYREDYTSRGSGYFDVAPRNASRTAVRRAYLDEDYDQRYERLPAGYRDGRGRDYDSLSGSKRPYSALDDAPPRYADTSVRHSRIRLDYEMSGSGSMYADTYAERLGRSHLGYGSGRSSLASQESNDLYGSRHGTGYGGSVSSSDVGGMYSSSYRSDYLSRGSDIGSSSYSSVYSGRSLSSGSGYLGSGGSGSYY